MLACNLHFELTYVVVMEDTNSSSWAKRRGCSQSRESDNDSGSNLVHFDYGLISYGAVDSMVESAERMA
jgi:hypothetical protein